MPVVGPAIPLVNGAGAQVPATPQSGGGGSAKIAGVLLQNLSAYTLIVQNGPDSAAIPPFTAWPMLQTSGVLSVTPETLGATIPAGTSSAVVPVYYRAGEQLPAPMPLVAAAIAAAIAGAVSVTSMPPVTGTVGLSGGTQVGINNSPSVGIIGGQAIGISGTPNVAVSNTPTVITAPTSLAVPTSGGNLTIPGNTVALCVWPAANTTAISLTGNQSGTPYYTSGGGTGTTLLQEPVVVYLDPADTTIAIGYSGATKPTAAAFPFAPAASASLQRTLDYAPSTGGGSGSGNVLSGAVSAAGTILTIPPNRAWLGTLWISATVASSSTQIQVGGTSGGYPASGTALAVVNTGTRAGAEIVVPDVCVLAGGVNTCTLVAAVAGTPTFNCGASGIIL